MACRLCDLCFLLFFRSQANVVWETVKMRRGGNVMREVISLQTTIFLLVLIGYVVKRKKIIGPQGQKNLTDLVIYVILPCNILKAFMAGQAGKNLKNYLRKPLKSLKPNI